MASSKELPARDRIAAAKTFATYLSLRMEQEKRDQRLDLTTRIRKLEELILPNPLEADDDGPPV
jgi:hypothetical protein